ncbi:MAG: NmrA family NAD(P)-binding protein [Myxococcales bacterium]|nr:NmrA family NAD(P)-binding protein [Myxococcales bacterium]
MFAVAGVSGHTGRVVAETLLAQKKPVRVIVRDAAKGQDWARRGAEVAVADLGDEGALTRALRGAEGAYLLLPPAMNSTDVRGDNARKTAAIARAVDAAGVSYVVFLSSIGSQHDAGTGPILSTHDAEAALAKTRAAVTFLRAPYFMENLATSLYALDKGELPVFLKLDRAIPMIATQDIGATAARLLLEGGHGHTVVELHGPREYSPMDVAAALSRITGKTVTANQGPEEAMIPALTAAGLNAHWAGLFKEMTHGMNTGHVAFEGGMVRTAKGTTELELVLRQLIGKK